MVEQDKNPPVTADGSSKNKSSKKIKRYGNKPTVQPVKCQGGKDDQGGNYLDCTAYGKFNRFMYTVQKISYYIGQEYKGGGVTRTYVMTQAAVIIPMPTRPAGRSVTAADGTTTVVSPDALDISDYQSTKKIVNNQAQNQTDSHQRVFSFMWQQCTELMHAKIKAHIDYHTIEQALNGIELLRVITMICFNIKDEKYAPQKVHETKSDFYAL
jgi:hypothetical protein